MNKCKKVCDNEYLNEHIRVVKEQGSKKPNKKTLKLIKGDCIRKICNPGCKNTNTIGVKDSFHSDYTDEEIKMLKGLGVLSWCHAKPMHVGNIKPFNVMNLSNTNSNNGGAKYKKNKTYNKKHGGKKWSMKYKKSINCRKPKGFSQKQHCKYGRNKTRKHK